MNGANQILDQFDRATQTYADKCHTDPSKWHAPNVAEFTRLRSLLLPHAEAGDARSQYALATIYWLGLCCDSEEEHRRTSDTSIQEATRWWIASASQGYWHALDNLVTNGVGPEAERARRAWDELNQERPDLIGRSHGMPVYGPAFVQELSRRLYSKVDPTIE